MEPQPNKHWHASLSGVHSVRPGSESKHAASNREASTGSSHTNPPGCMLHTSAGLSAGAAAGFVHWPQPLNPSQSSARSGAAGHVLTSSCVGVSRRRLNARR